MCYLHIFNVGLKGSEDFVHATHQKISGPGLDRRLAVFDFYSRLCPRLCLAVIYSHVFGHLVERNTEQFKLPLCPENKAPCRNLEFPSYTKNINN